MSVTYYPKIVTEGMVLCLDAGNRESYSGSGTLWKDLSAAGTDFSLSRSPVFSQGNGGILGFNGATQYASIPANNNFNFTASAIDFSIEAWVYPTATGSIKAIVANWGQGGLNVSDSWLLWSNNGILSFSWSPFSTSTPLLTGSTIQLNKWTHVAVTRSGNVFSMYIDGSLVKTASNSSTSNSSYSIEIGRYGTNDSAYWSGYLSIVRIYRNRSLTSVEVLQNYNATRNRYSDQVATGPDIVRSNLIMYYDFGDVSSYTGSGTSVLDLSGNGLTATLVNSPTYSSASGGYMDFSGTSYATVTNTLIGSIRTGDYTIDLWIYWPGNTGYGHIYSMSSQSSYFFKHSSGGLYDGYAAASSGGGGSLASGAWRHVVVTRSGGTSVFYVNATQTYTRANSFDLNQNTLNIRSDGGVGEWVRLYIALPKLYKKGLTQAEVTQNFNMHKGRFGL